MEVVDGDPRNVLCEAVDKHHASILVVGSHGYGAIKRYRFLLILVMGLKKYDKYFSETCEWGRVYQK